MQLGFPAVTAKCRGVVLAEFEVLGSALRDRRRVRASRSPRSAAHERAVRPSWSVMSMLSGELVSCSSRLPPCRPSTILWRVEKPSSSRHSRVENMLWNSRRRGGANRLPKTFIHTYSSAQI